MEKMIVLEVFKNLARHRK